MYKMTARQNPPSISIDTRNMYTSQVGAEGIAPEELNAIRHRLAELHAELAAKFAGLAGRTLPDERIRPLSSALDAIAQAKELTALFDLLR